MANFLKSGICNSMVAYFTIASLSTTLLAPPYLIAAPGGNINPNDINFGIKIEKVYEKVKRAIEKGETNKIVSYMFDFKQEVEQYSGQKIDINKQIDEAQRQAKAQGQKIDDKYIKAIKKEFNKNDNKHKHRAVWFAQCNELDIP